MVSGERGQLRKKTLTSESASYQNLADLDIKIYIKKKKVFFSKEKKKCKWSGMAVLSGESKGYR